MPLSDAIDMARLQLRDKAYPYRWDTPTLIRYTNDCIKDMRRLRPDMRISSTGGEIAYVEIPMVDAFTFTSTQTTPTYVTGFNLIQGWAYNTYPTLYFKAVSASLSAIYASSSDRTNDANRLATFPSSVATQATLTEGTFQGSPSGFGGLIMVSTIIPSSTAFEVTVTSPNMIVENNTYDEAIANYICEQCLAGESEDTFNGKRASDYHKDYVNQIMGGM